MSRDWCVYLVTCSDGTLYCGTTNDLDKRLATHNAGKGAKYTRSRLPVKLATYCDGLTKSEALRLEARVKKQPRACKVAFLEAGGDV